MKHLFIRLRELNPNAEVEHVFFATDGTRLEHGRATLVELVNRVQGLRVQVIVPAHDVAHFAVRLPPMPRAKIRSSLPYALEDQLLEDCESLHFAYQDTAESRLSSDKEGHELSVASINQARLRAWLELLQSAGITAQALYSEQSVLLARDAALITICLENERALCARAPSALLEVERSRLASNLPAWLALTLRDREAATTLEIIGERDLLEEAHMPLGSLVGLAREEFGLATQEQPLSAFLWLAQTALTESPINLLQGAFAPLPPPRTSWQPWRIPAALAAILVALVLGDLFLLGKGVPAGSPAPTSAATSAPQPEARVDALYTVIEALALEGQAVDLRLDALRIAEDGQVELKGSLANQGALEGLIAALGARGWTVQTDQGNADHTAIALRLQPGSAAAPAAAGGTPSSEEMRAWIAAQAVSAGSLSLTESRDDSPARVLLSGRFADLLALLERLPKEGLTVASAALERAEQSGEVRGELRLQRLR